MAKRKAESATITTEAVAGLLANAQPTVAPGPSRPTDDRAVRAKTCNEEIMKIMQKYNCVFNISKLDISTGKIFPQLDIVAR